MQKRILEEYKNAMKSGNKTALTTLTTLRANIKNFEIDLRTKNKELTDSDVMSVINKMIKQDKESIEMFEKGGRNDLIQTYKDEIDLLQTFLPKQLTEEEIDAIIGSVIKEGNYTSIKDMGKIVGTIKSKYAGQVDMSMVSSKVKGLLG